MQTVLKLSGVVVEKHQQHSSVSDAESVPPPTGRKGVIRINVTDYDVDSVETHTFISEDGCIADARLPAYNHGHQKLRRQPTTSITIRTEDPAMLDAVSIGELVTVELVGSESRFARNGAEIESGWSPLTVKKAISDALDPTEGDCDKAKSKVGILRQLPLKKNLAKAKK